MTQSLIEEKIEKLRADFPIIMGATFGFEERLRQALTEVQEAQKQSDVETLEKAKVKLPPECSTCTKHCMWSDAMTYNAALDEAINKIK